MAEVIILPVLLSAHRLITKLKDLHSMKKYNVTIVHEIDSFIQSLNENIDLLKEQLPKKDSSWALESLRNDLDEAAANLEEGLQNGDFEKFWQAKQIKDLLERLREDLIHKFQVKLFITTLEVVIYADKKMDNFESKMVELSALSAAKSHAAMDDIRKLLQPLVVGMKRQDKRIQSFVSMVRDNEGKVETSTETQKFLADVMANLEDLTDDVPKLEKDYRDYLDPITKELMIDPVKCKDGRTYDRFAVFEYNLTQNRAQNNPLVIACDDFDVRSRLFEKFGSEGVESKFHSRRKAYRSKALEVRDLGHTAEALAMIQNVLEWAPDDKECRQIAEDLQHQINQHNMHVAASTHKSAPPATGHYVVPNIESINKGNSGVPDQSIPYGPYTATKDVENMALSIIIMIMCFPCSLCCIPCLFPGACGGKKDKQ